MWLTIKKKALSYLVILYHACSFIIQYPLPLWRMPYLPCGSKMLFTPPNLTFIFKQRLDRVCGVVLCTFFIWTHCVAIPSTVSPTRFTSAAKQRKKNYIFCVLNQINVGDIESVTPGVLVKWLFKEKKEKKIPWPNPALQKSSSQFSTASISSQHSTSVLDITKGTAGWF